MGALSGVMINKLNLDTYTGEFKSALFIRPCATFKQKA